MTTQKLQKGLDALPLEEEKVYRVRESEPKVLFADADLVSGDPIGDLAKILKQNGIDASA